MHRPPHARGPRGLDLQAVAEPLPTDQLAGQSERGQFAAQTVDIDPELFGRKLGCLPGPAHQLLRGEVLVGVAHEVGKELSLARCERGLLSAVANQLPPPVQRHAAQPDRLRAVGLAPAIRLFRGQSSATTNRRPPAESDSRAMSRTRVNN